MLPKFVDQVYHLPPRILDLLEIAAYVFAADRASSRGPNNSLEFSAWARSMRFIIKVRDIDFWSQETVRSKLSAVLTFMTGDSEYFFDFLPGHSTPPASLFDTEEFGITPKGQACVVLFSGGLDSLAGAMSRLETTSEDLYLISHRSGQPSTKRTQNCLATALADLYPDRIHHYSFDCGLSHKHAVEETQRTRAFLFGSVAFALAQRLSLNSFLAYENGVTSLNMLRRQDLISARASRTTHPKTHFLMSQFLSEVQGGPVKVLNPFWNLTKADILILLAKSGGQDLIGSAVSCSRTFQRRCRTSTHCGCCFQCIDRRLAAYAAGLQDVDNVGIYSEDIFLKPIDSPETRTVAVDYIRQAIRFSQSSDDAFAMERLSELSDITPHIEGKEEEALEAIWRLCQRHGDQVVAALMDIRRELDDPRSRLKQGSLLQLVADREYLKTDSRRLAEHISEMLSASLPIAFKTHKPSRESEVNDQIDALLSVQGESFRREFPIIQFALAKVIPDHEALAADLVVEAKYVRKGTSPSKATEGIAADITKYPSGVFILFIVYDPGRAISDDSAFRNDIEDKRPCLVSVVR
jgi:hypothetical protein